MMRSIPKRRLRSIIFISLGVLSIALGLWFNIHTIRLNQEIHSLEKEYRDLRRETRQYEAQVLQRSGYDVVERIARDELNMHEIKKIHYIKVNE